MKLKCKILLISLLMLMIIALPINSKAEATSINKIYIMESNISSTENTTDKDKNYIREGIKFGADLGKFFNELDDAIFSVVVDTLVQDDQIKESVKNDENAFLGNEEISFCQLKSTLKIFRVVGILLAILKVIIPLLLIIYASFDFAKAVTSSDEAAIKKSLQLVTKRAIAGVCVFFVPTLVFYAVSLISNSVSEDKEFNNCNVCLFKVSNCVLKDDSIEIIEVPRKTYESLECEALSANSCSKRPECRIKGTASGVICETKCSALSVSTCSKHENCRPEGSNSGIHCVDK